MKTCVMVIILIVFCAPVRAAWAAFTGPEEIYAGQLTEYNTVNVDGLGKSLKLKFFIRSDGTYVETCYRDGSDDDVCVYGQSGLVKQFSTSQGMGFQSLMIEFAEHYVYVMGSNSDSSGKRKKNIYIYDYAGNMKSTIYEGSYTGSFQAALSNGDFITKAGKDGNYYKYSLSGQLIKVYTSKPLELGVVKSQYLGVNKYRTTVTCDDKVYSIVADTDFSKFQRDDMGNIYVVSFISVDKYNDCGKLLGRFEKPSNVVFREENVKEREPEIIKHDSYGYPIIDAHGNIYVSKETPTKYSILKWTWVDDPNVPSGPDAPSGISVIASTTGLYLTWIASPQDPGCVTGYEISRATSAGGMGTTVGTTTPGKVTFNDSTAVSGITYYYKVRAVSGSEYSPFTSEVSSRRP